VHCPAMSRSSIRAPGSVTPFYLAFLTCVGCSDRSGAPDGDGFSRAGVKPCSIGEWPTKKRVAIAGRDGAVEGALRRGGKGLCAPGGINSL